MTVIQLPCPTDFTADMQDLILQSADTISFTVHFSAGFLSTFIFFICLSVEKW